MDKNTRLQQIEDELTEIHMHLQECWSDRRDDDGNRIYCPDWCSGSGQCAVCMADAEIDDLFERQRELEKELHSL